MKTANATHRGRAELKWARLWPRWDSPFQAAVSGWKNLEDAVLLGDDGLSKGWLTRDGLQARIRWNHYVARLPFVPPAVDEIAMSYSRRWPVTVNHIDRLAATWLRASLVGTIGREAFRSGVEFLLDSIGLDQVESDEAIRSPVKLLKLAYTQLLALPKRSDDGFRLAAFWLVLLGCAVDCLPYPDCKLCFRHALHGHSYCLSHSQAAAFQGTRSQKARRYYVGRKTARELDWDRRKPVIQAHAEFEIPNLISRHLWGTLPGGEVDLFKRIRKQLAGSPNVRQRLDGPIPRGNAALDALLRDKLDPLELLPQAWPEKIMLAEHWFSCELRQAPGVRGRSRALNAKIQRAERLASRGMSIGQIAKTLGCSTATIRSWRTRGQAQRLSQILSCQSQSKSSAHGQTS
ncbi:helix-turn-helix domain-containing protein [Paraburkholderia tropica]|uniref:helix-turn-helix domain-containing protein n=1 Tax=Paraburkholderia tropica TaxID=92647 RepID=UPI002AB64408|nr:helix-turn-helix domain-containing protein [Paraburkholderia tropica]